ncbi:MAG: ATP-binding protein [Bacteroidota bacterium]
MIKKAVIRDYRSCLETDVELHPELTVLIGANGVGKSNILQALDLLSKIEQTRRIEAELVDTADGYYHSNIVLDVVLEQKRKYITDLSIIYTEENTNGEESIKIADVKYAKEQPNLDYRFLDFNAFSHSSMIRMINKSNWSALDELKKEKFEEELPIIDSFRNISYYNVAQFVGAKKCPPSVELSPFGHSIKDSSAKSHASFIRDLYSYSLNYKHIYSQYISIVGIEGLNLIEDIKFDVTQIPIQSTGFRKNGEKDNRANKFIITLSLKVDGIYLLPNQLSDGTFRTLALIFYMLSDKNDLLLIEEPESLVHHGLLSSIIELIKQESKRKQIVVSTHSDLVVDKIKPENIVLVKKDKEKGTLAEPLTKKLSKNEYEALKEYLETEGNLGEYWLETGLEYEV